MKKFTQILCLGLILAATACVPSLHPLFTEDSLIFEESLVGTWEEDDNIWQFRKSSSRSYKLIMTDAEGRKGEFETHLVKIGEHRYLDLYPVEPDLEENDFYKMHLLPTHTFMWVKQIEPNLQLSPMGPGAIKELVSQYPEAVKHEIVQDTVVLTAHTQELQAFVKKFHDFKGLFGEPGDLERVK